MQVYPVDWIMEGGFTPEQKKIVQDSNQNNNTELLRETKHALHFRFSSAQGNFLVWIKKVDILYTQGLRKPFDRQVLHIEGLEEWQQRQLFSSSKEEFLREFDQFSDEDYMNFLYIAGETLREYQQTGLTPGNCTSYSDALVKGKLDIIK